MKHVALSARDRRALLLAAGIIPAFFIVGRGIPAALTWSRTARRHAVEASAAVARARARIGMRQPLFDSLRVRQARMVAGLARLLPGRDPGSAEAALAGLVARAATTAGVRLKAVRPLAVATDDSGATTALRTVAVRADVTGDIRGLVRFFTALEGSQTDLAIRTFGITQPDPVGAPDRMETLDLTLTVEGMLRGRGGGPP